MARSNRILAALAVAGAFALTSCHSGAGGNGKTDANVKILAKGSNGHPTEVRIDGKNWPVCKKAAAKDCISPIPAGLA